MKSEFEIAITQLCSDRNLSPEIIIEAIEAALASAYKRNYSENQNITVDVDPRSGQARVFINRVVVENVEDADTQIALSEARALKKDVILGDTVSQELTPQNFGRIAAQTAKQVIMQRIREAERDSVYLEYADRAGEIINGVIREIDARTRNVRVNLGKAEAILPRSEQIPGENYRFNQRIRAYIVEVERTGHGPQITLSRTHAGLLRRLLELEVPEIYSGTVEVKAIAREAGWRSKVAVAATQPGVDPVGSCVGMRGVRIQNIVNELNGEKIDVVAWAPDVDIFISNALSPAKVLSVYLNQVEKTAKVIVPDKSLSLAIGKEGQNARLAAKLTGWRIDIRSESDAAVEVERLAAEAVAAEAHTREIEAARQAAAALLAEAEAGLEAEGEETVPAEAQEAITQPQAAEQLVTPETKVSEEQVAAQEQAAIPETGQEPRSETRAESVSLEAEAALPQEQAGTTEDPALEETAEDGTVGEETREQTAEAGEQSTEEWEEEEGDEDKTKSKDRRKRDRKRQLEFDERLGQVVARKKRKPGRDRKGWDTEDW